MSTFRSFGAALAAVLCLVLCPAANAVVLLTEDFNTYAGTQNNTQYQTGWKVAYNGNVSGWSKTGAGVMHAVDLANLAGQTNA